MGGVSQTSRPASASVDRYGLLLAVAGRFRNKINSMSPKRASRKAKDRHTPHSLGAGIPRSSNSRGRNVAACVTHEAGKFIYFYLGQTGFIIFASA